MDKNPYRHDGRADKDTYRHDGVHIASAFFLSSYTFLTSMEDIRQGSDASAKGGGVS